MQTFDLIMYIVGLIPYLFVVWIYMLIINFINDLHAQLFGLNIIFVVLMQIFIFNIALLLLIIFILIFKWIINFSNLYRIDHLAVSLKVFEYKKPEFH